MMSINDNLYIVADDMQRNKKIINIQAQWRVVRAVEGARLESVCTGNCT